MIVLTRLNESHFAVNPDLIERIHSNPDTTLVMVDGSKYIVTESMDQVIAMITGYRAEIIRLARDLPVRAVHGGHQLGLVPDPTPEDDDAFAPVPLRPRHS